MKLERQPDYLFAAVNGRLAEICRDKSIPPLCLGENNREAFAQWIMVCNSRIKTEEDPRLAVRLKFINQSGGEVYMAGDRVPFGKGHGKQPDQPQVVSVAIFYSYFIRSFYLIYPVPARTETVL